MHRYIFLTVIFFILLLSESGFCEVDISGEFLTDNRFRIKGDNKFTWNENRLTLKLDSEISGAHLYSEIWLRGFGFPSVSQSSDLQEKIKDKVSPWAIELREAYIDFYKLFTDNLELRIGMQRIAWGTADKLNPTDTKGHRRKRLHQFLTEATGLRVLRDRIAKITGLMQISANKRKFKELYERLESKQRWFNFPED